MSRPGRSSSKPTRKIRFTSRPKARSTTSARRIARSAVLGSREPQPELSRSPVTRAIQFVVFALAFAQGPTALYDRARKVTLEGPVTQIEWVNPRAFAFIDVRDTSGTVTNWAVEIGNPLDLERDGWKRSTLHVGDVVAI